MDPDKGAKGPERGENTCLGVLRKSCATEMGLESAGFDKMVVGLGVVT